MEVEDVETPVDEDAVCQMLIAGTICGKKETAEIHHNDFGHTFRKESWWVK